VYSCPGAGGEYGFLSISWLSVLATLGRALRQAESALRETEVAAAIARTAATAPKKEKDRIMILMMRS
jgi:hypothetical protein